MNPYQLVTNNIPTRVIELQSSVFAALDQLGIMPELVLRKLALPDVERCMYVGRSRRVKLPE